MAYSLDKILGFVIPVGVILVFVLLIYWKLQEPANFIGKKIWSLFMKGVDAVSGSMSGSTIKEITYK